MSWWKKLIFSVISLVWGYVSLDYLYSAFCRLSNVSGNAVEYTPVGDGLQQLVGAFMFLIWFFVLAVYFWIIKKTSPQIDLIEEDIKTGNRRVKKKWTDIVLQSAFIITGMFLRWAYIIFIYLPGME